jgi:hypothetical protein
MLVIVHSFRIAAICLGPFALLHLLHSLMKRILRVSLYLCVRTAVEILVPRFAFITILLLPHAFHIKGAHVLILLACALSHGVPRGAELRLCIVTALRLVSTRAVANLLSRHFSC